MDQPDIPNLKLWLQTTDNRHTTDIRTPVEASLRDGLIRNAIFDQKSPVHTVSVSRAGGLSVTDTGHSGTSSHWSGWTRSLGLHQSVKTEFYNTKIEGERIFTCIMLFIRTFKAERTRRSKTAKTAKPV